MRKNVRPPGCLWPWTAEHHSDLLPTAWLPSSWGDSGWNPVCACQVPCLILRTAVEPTPSLRLQDLGWAQQVRARPPWLGFTGKGRSILFRGEAEPFFLFSVLCFHLPFEKPCSPTGHIYTNKKFFKLSSASLAVLMGRGLSDYPHMQAGPQAGGRETRLARALEAGCTAMCVVGCVGTPASCVSVLFQGATLHLPPALSLAALGRGCLKQ